MKRETATLNTREQQRAMALNVVERDGLTGAEAGRLMGLSLRQAGAKAPDSLQEGVAALVHGSDNVGEAPACRIIEDTKKASRGRRVDRL